MGPARPVRRCNPSDLARYQPQPPAMEGAAEGRRHRRVAIPTHFEHGCLLTGECEGRAKSCRMAAGVNDQVAVGLCSVRRREADTERLR
jgi:hypothetical protein